MERTSYYIVENVKCRQTLMENDCNDLRFLKF